MRRKSFIVLAIIFLVANIVTWQFVAEFRENNLRVVFFDVGQGDAVFVRTPQNHYILIDGGPGDIVLERLSEELPFFYRSIDLIILTHPHDDHASGLIEVASRYMVKDIVCTGVDRSSGIMRKWSEIRDEKGYRVGQAGMRVSANDFYIDVLYPVDSLVGTEPSDLNEASIATRLTYGDKASFMLTGDLYKEQEQEILSYYQQCVNNKRSDCQRLSLQANVLKLGHHGSHTSTDEDFLFAVAPSVAVVTVGKDNRYGHPHSEVLEKLKQYGILIKRTDRDGSIDFEVW